AAGAAGREAVAGLAVVAGAGGAGATSCAPASTGTAVSGAATAGVGTTLSGSSRTATWFSIVASDGFAACTAGVWACGATGGAGGLGGITMAAGGRATDCGVMKRGAGL